MWIVQARGSGDGSEGYLYLRVGQGWAIAPRATVDSRATRIAVAPNGQAWTIMSSGASTDVYVYGAGLHAAALSAPQLQLRNVYSPSVVPVGRASGAPIDIGVGGLDTAYVVVPEPPELTRTFLLRWDGAQWGRFHDSVRRVAVEPNGTPWVVMADGQVARLDGVDWRVIGRIRADDIGVGANGQAWVVAGGIVYFWDGTTWEQAVDPSSAFIASAVAVSPEGTPWILDQNGRIFTRA